jgi:hypothetical protein
MPLNKTDDRFPSTWKEFIKAITLEKIPAYIDQIATAFEKIKADKSDPRAQSSLWFYRQVYMESKRLSKDTHKSSEIMSNDFNQEEVEHFKSINEKLDAAQILKCFKSENFAIERIICEFQEENGLTEEDMQEVEGLSRAYRGDRIAFIARIVGYFKGKKAYDLAEKFKNCGRRLVAVNLRTENPVRQTTVTNTLVGLASKTAETSAITAVQQAPNNESYYEELIRKAARTFAEKEIGSTNTNKLKKVDTEGKLINTLFIELSGDEVTSKELQKLHEAFDDVLSKISETVGNIKYFNIFYGDGKNWLNYKTHKILESKKGDLQQGLAKIEAKKGALIIIGATAVTISNAIVEYFDGKANTPVKAAKKHIKKVKSKATGKAASEEKSRVANKANNASKIKSTGSKKSVDTENMDYLPSEEDTLVRSKRNTQSIGAIQPIVNKSARNQKYSGEISSSSSESASDSMTSSSSVSTSSSSSSSDSSSSDEFNNNTVKPLSVLPPNSISPHEKGEVEEVIKDSTDEYATVAYNTDDNTQESKVASQRQSAIRHATDKMLSEPAQNLAGDPTLSPSEDLKDNDPREASLIDLEAPDSPFTSYFAPEEIKEVEALQKKYLMQQEEVKETREQIEASKQNILQVNAIVLEELTEFKALLEKAIRWLMTTENHFESDVQKYIEQRDRDLSVKLGDIQVPVDEKQWLNYLNNDEHKEKLPFLKPQPSEVKSLDFDKELENDTDEVKAMRKEIDAKFKEYEKAYINCRLAYYKINKAREIMLEQSKSVYASKITQFSQTKARLDEAKAREEERKRTVEETREKLNRLLKKPRQNTVT